MIETPEVESRRSVDNHMVNACIYYRTEEVVFSSLWRKIPKAGASPLGSGNIVGCTAAPAPVRLTATSYLGKKIGKNIGKM
jgi:hypothetical protein